MFQSIRFNVISATTSIDSSSADQKNHMSWLPFISSVNLLYDMFTGGRNDAKKQGKRFQGRCANVICLRVQAWRGNERIFSAELSKLFLSDKLAWDNSLSKFRSPFAANSSISGCSSLLCT